MKITRIHSTRDTGNSSEQVKSLFLALCLAGGSLDSKGNDGGIGGLVVLGDGKSLAVSGESEEGTSALSADVSVGVLSHVGGGRAVGALLLQFLDLAVGLNREVLEEGLGALLVGVLDLLRGGVHLLFSLTLTTLGVDERVHDALVLEASLNKGELAIELSGTEDDTVNGVLSGILNLGSTGQNG